MSRNPASKSTSFRLLVWGRLDGKSRFRFSVEQMSESVWRNEHRSAPYTVEERTHSRKVVRPSYRSRSSPSLDEPRLQCWGTSRRDDSGGVCTWSDPRGP